MSVNPITTNFAGKALTLDKKALAELQAKYGESCLRYEELADKKLQRSDTIIVSGKGCALRVKNEALSVFPGVSHDKQKQETVKLYRGVHGVRCIILLADKGLITLDAISWCKDQGITILMLDIRGAITQAFYPNENENAPLQRAQYRAECNGKAEYVAAQFISRKILQQAETLRKHTDLPGYDAAIDAVEKMLGVFCLDELPAELKSIDALRLYEGRAANAYFNAWIGTPIKWEKASKKTLPPHWLQVESRGSGLSHNRNATNPAQAILNYAYALLESQVRQALNARGFSLSCGFLHTDKVNRDSLVYDVMELYRAQVDDLVLKLLEKTTFQKGDLMTTPDGTVKFNPQLSRFIVASCRLPQKDIDEGALLLKEWLLS